MPPPGMPAPGMPGAPSADAGWGSRLGAYIVDYIIGLLFTIPAIVAIVAGPTEIEPCQVSGGEIVLGGEDFNALCEGPTNGTIAITVLLGLIGFAVYLIWRARMEGATGQTVGKKALGIRTVDINTGMPIGTGRAIGRYFAYFVSGIVCYLGFLWPLWDARRQAWHDKMLSTRVVRA